MKFIDLTGQTFGLLTVISQAKNHKKAIQWNCICACGGSSVSARGSLISGNTKSCGCIVKARAVFLNKSHGMSGTSEYNSWSGMIQRCYTKNHPRYYVYGKRGITVCKEWRDSFQVFFDDMGIKPSKSHSIDRKNNDLGYFPENCHWATGTEQANNKSNNRILTLKGESLTVSQWSKKTGIKSGSIISRIRYGWNAEQILTTPIKSTNVICYNGISKTAKEWSDETGIKQSTIYRRLGSGWSIEKTLKTKRGHRGGKNIMLSTS